MQAQPIFTQKGIMLHDVEEMINSILKGHLPDLDSLNYPDVTFSQTSVDTDIFGGLVGKAPSPTTVDGALYNAEGAHLFTPPVTPDRETCDSSDGQSGCGTCPKCLQTASTKADKRRQQNRLAQRTYRARKEAELSQAKTRIHHLERLLKAQERSYLQLKYIVEKLKSEQFENMHTRYLTNDHTTSPVPAFNPEMSGYFVSSHQDQGDVQDWLSPDVSKS